MIYGYMMFVGRNAIIGIATPVGGEIFGTHPDCSWGPPGLLYGG